MALSQSCDVVLVLYESTDKQVVVLWVISITCKFGVRQGKSPILLSFHLLCSFKEVITFQRDCFFIWWCKSTIDGRCKDRICWRVLNSLKSSSTEQTHNEYQLWDLSSFSGLLQPHSRASETKLTSGVSHIIPGCHNQEEHGKTEKHSGSGDFHTPYFLMASIMPRDSKSTPV